MDVIVTVRYRISNVCAEDDLAPPGFTLDHLVRDMIRSEGLIGIVDDVVGEVLSVEEVPDELPTVH